MTDTQVKPQRRKASAKVAEPIEQKVRTVDLQGYKDIDWKQFVPQKYVEIDPYWLASEGISQTDYASYNDEQKTELKSRAGDDNLTILLAGFKYLAHMRGIQSVKYTTHVNKDEVVAECNLCFDGCNIVFPDPNIGTQFFPPATYSALATANTENTSYPFSMFLASMAENRAFIRAVKMAFNINVVGTEELQQPAKPSGLLNEDGCSSPQDSLKGIISMKGKSFQDLKNTLLKKEWPGCSDWSDYKDIPEQECLKIIDVILTKKG